MWMAGALLLVGCDASSPPGDATAEPFVRDSAGIEIVELGPVSYDQLPQWRLADRPDVDIGQVEGEEPYLLFRVPAGRVLLDGRIAIINNVQIRMFDESGVHLWSQGRRGDGPAEYRNPRTLSVVAGDTLVVWDIWTFKVLTSEGNFVRVVRPDSLNTSPRIHGATARGEVLAWDCTSEFHDGPVYRERRIMCDAMILDLDGRFRRSLGRRMTYRDLLHPRTMMATQDPWERFPVAGASLEGTWYGSGRDYELWYYSDTSRLPRIIRWKGPDRTVTEDDIRSYDKRIREQNLPASQIQFEASIPKPDRIPAFQELVIDGTGRLWLRDYERWDRERPAPIVRWTILARDGLAVLGRFEHPEGLRLLDAGPGWVLVCEPDELDVEHVRIYQLVAPPGTE